MIEFLKKINPSKFHIALAIGVFAVSILCYIIYIQYHKIEKTQVQLQALTDTVVLYKTKNGKNGAYIRVLQGSKSELLAALKAKDPAAYNFIKNTPGLHSVTNLSTETKIDTVVKVDTIRVLDANNNPVSHDSIYISKNITNKYYNADIKVKNDSIALGLKVKNDFTIATQDTNLNKGLFKFLKPKSYIVKVVNNNPYTYNTGLSTYEIKQKTIVVPVLGVTLGIGLAAFLLLHK